VSRPADDAPLLLLGVEKSIGGRRILRDVDLDCRPGTITALLGPNGAGKTTTVSIAAGLRRADVGTARVFGYPARSAAARTRFSLVPQDIGLPSTVRVSECLEFVTRQRPESPLAEPVERISARLGIEKLLAKHTGGLSGGERRRVSLALGLARVPGLLILDEATTNLDEVARAQAWQAVRDYADRGGAVLATSHILADIEANADRVIAMADGQVVRQGSVADIRQLLGGSVVSVRVTSRHAADVLGAVRRSGLGEIREWSGGRADDGSDGSVLSWRSERAVELVALLATLDGDLRDLAVSPVPLGELLSPRPAAAWPTW
jgi:ABC-2 type transport system ATP-binding protein